MALLLDTQTAVLEAAALTFRFVVPGDQRWTLRSVYAVADRDVGGVPDRAYTLTISNGTDIVAEVGAQDDGAEPGTCAITWANAPAAAVATGGDGVVVAPLGPLVLPAGYTITGTITMPAPADAWESALVWFDFVYTNLAGSR